MFIAKSKGSTLQIRVHLLHLWHLLLFLSSYCPSPLPTTPSSPSPSRQQEELLYLKISKWRKTAHKIMHIMCKKCKIYKFLLFASLTHKQVFIEKTTISDWQQVFTF